MEGIPARWIVINYSLEWLILLTSIVMFEVRNLSLARFGRRIIDGLDLSVPAPGSLALIGPGGAGKSSLLLAVAGGNAEAGEPVMSGEVTLDGASTHALGEALGWYRQWHDVAVDAPSAARATHRSEEEKRAISRDRLHRLAEFAAVPRRLYLLDEPTALMTDEDAARARELIAALTDDAFVLMTTHNRRDCAALDGHMAIIAGGSVREAGPTRELLSNPCTEDGRRWLETGYVAHPAPAMPIGPSEGVWWVVPGLLCGLSRPGMIAPAEQQYRLLADHGVRHLVCLEDVDAEAEADAGCAAFGVTRHEVPMPDMCAPTFGQAADFCRMAEVAIARNEGVAFHCKGGLGRTGTALAAVLIWHGDAASEAIAKIRRAQRLAIQSQAQMDFLHAFADRLRDGPTPAASATDRRYNDVLAR